MDSSPRFRLAPLVVALALPVASAVSTPGQVSAQSTAGSSVDSATLVSEAHKRQRDFEAFRASRIPLSREPSRGRCDVLIGRICIWYGGEDEEDFPPEPPETTLARSELVRLLSTSASQIRDPWITGQLVRYLLEEGQASQAEQVAEDCGLTERWWCHALLGYVLQIRGSFVDAETAFRSALDSMPDKERARWTTPGYLLSKDGDALFKHATPEARERLWRLFWRLSDPLYLVPGNDRLTEHYARLVEADLEEDAGNPQSLDWGEDMEEALVRYGRMIGWSRSRQAPPGMQGGRLTMQDTRTVIGHHAPRSRGYLFPDDFLKAPADVPPESWITAPREARTWYSPPYAPDFTELETQVGRFRRGDEMLVVGAYQPAAPEPVSKQQEKPRFQLGAGRPRAYNPFDRGRPTREQAEPDTASPQPVEIEGPVETGLYLVPEDGGPALDVRGDAPEGVLTLKVPQGRYVSSMELFEPGARRAWRARQGLSQAPLTPGVAAVSDLLILKEGAPLPETLDEAIPEVRPGVRIHEGERFVVVWEVYGLRIQERIGVTLGFTRGRPGFLQRVGRFVGVLKPEQPVDVTFQDTGPAAVHTAFRAVQVQLPKLDPGAYTLHLRLDLSGREPVVTSRPITIVP